MAGIEEELQGTHYRELKPYSKGPSSRVVVSLMLLPLLLSLQPKPQQHNCDNHTTTTATLYAIVAVIVISAVVIIILPLALLELTRPIFLMVHLFYLVTAASHEGTIKRATTKTALTSHLRSRREEGRFRKPAVTCGAGIPYTANKLLPQCTFGRDSEGLQFIPSFFDYGIALRILPFYR